MRFPGPPTTWNDWLALLVLAGIPIIWMFGHLDSDTRGATVIGWVLVLQYYFRKQPPDPPAA